MHWFVWVLIILFAANIGTSVAEKRWAGVISSSLMLAGVIAYVT